MKAEYVTKPSCLARNLNVFIGKLRKMPQNGVHLIMAHLVQRVGNKVVREGNKF